MQIVNMTLARHRPKHAEPILLNAGSGIYRVQANGYTEIALDLFPKPIAFRERGVCGDIQNLPFKDSCFSVVVCIGEVMAYCDPARALREFARALLVGGLIIFDFGSTRSGRFLGKPEFGRAAELVSDQYNGSPEPVWRYSPEYILALVASGGFNVVDVQGTHSWSAIGARLGLREGIATTLEQRLSWLPTLTPYADVITVVAERV